MGPAEKSPGVSQAPERVLTKKLKKLYAALPQGVCLRADALFLCRTLVTLLQYRPTEKLWCPLLLDRIDQKKLLVDFAGRPTTCPSDC